LYQWHTSTKGVAAVQNERFQFEDLRAIISFRGSQVTVAGQTVYQIRFSELSLSSTLRTMNLHHGTGRLAVEHAALGCNCLVSLEKSS
jgi:hypothetical protein